MITSNPTTGLAHLIVALRLQNAAARIQSEQAKRRTPCQFPGSLAGEISRRKSAEDAQHATDASREC